MPADAPFSLSLCIPVLNRYDCLSTLLLSLWAARRAHRTLPTRVVVVDNWRSPEALERALRPNPGVPTSVYVPDVPMGLAESWNWCTRFAPADWLICNDDVTFSADSFTLITDTPGVFVSPLAGTSAAFSCFLLRQAAIDAVGEFDETISPGYAYFEDNDYAERLRLAGLDIVGVEAGVEHAGSQTLQRYTPEQLDQHHRKFETARTNFYEKWGFLPGDPR